jgi:hypothetical protein
MYVYSIITVWSKKQNNMVLFHLWFCTGWYHQLAIKRLCRFCDYCNIPVRICLSEKLIGKFNNCIRKCKKNLFLLLSKNPLTSLYRAGPWPVWLHPKGLQGDVVYLCWPVAPSSPNARGGGIAGSQPVGAAVHITWHGAQINFGDLPPYLTYASSLFLSLSSLVRKFSRLWGKRALKMFYSE